MMSPADQLPRPEIERLVGKLGSDSPIKSGRGSQIIEEIRTRPDIKPDLFAMVAKAVQSQDWERVGPPLYALGLRADLTEDELGQIVSPLRAYMDSPDRDTFAEAFILAGLPVLKHCPSEEHEQLALRGLEFGDRSIQMSALKALEGIGTEDSIPTLKDYMIHREVPDPDYNIETKSIIQTIERRMKERSKTSGPADHVSSVSKMEPKKAEADSSRSGVTASETKWSLLAAALALLAVSLGYLKWRRVS